MVQKKINYEKSYEDQHEAVIANIINKVSPS